MWVDPDDDPRETLDEGTGEKAVLAAYLDRYRMPFEMKCEGLDSEQLAQRSVPPSTMSLLGLVRHLASVEHAWPEGHSLHDDEWSQQDASTASAMPLGACDPCPRHTYRSVGAS